jgi:hypothetical protein
VKIYRTISNRKVNVPFAQFEEKEYELQFSIELAKGRFGTVWGAGQVLEGIVGYDGVADPDIKHIVWKILKIPRPKGVILSPALWRGGSRPSPSDLNSKPITFVLQYKRPEYLRGARASQWNLWHKPYYRFKRSAKQQSILARLEQNLSGSAVVRYASPAFWTRADYEANASTGTVIEKSGFVSPNALKRHSVWTYIEPGIEGKANPSGQKIQFESASGLEKLLNSSSYKDKSESIELVDEYGYELARQFGSLADYRQPTLRKEIKVFAENLMKTELNLSTKTRISIIALAAFTTLLENIGASWYLVKRTPSMNT